MEAVRRDATRREWDRRCWAGEGDDVGDCARIAKFEADRDALKKCVADGVFPEALLPQVLAAIAPCLKSRPTSFPAHASRIVGRPEAVKAQRRARVSSSGRSGSRKLSLGGLDAAICSTWREGDRATGREGESELCQS